MLFLIYGALCKKVFALILLCKKVLHLYLFALILLICNFIIICGIQKNTGNVMNIDIES